MSEGPGRMALVRRGVSVALVLGLLGALVGLGRFSRSLSLEERWAASELLSVRVHLGAGALSSTSTRPYRFPDGHVEHLSDAEAHARLTALLGGRSVSFLARQAAWRALPLALLG